jgi:hypothetical protein
MVRLLAIAALALASLAVASPLQARDDGDLSIFKAGGNGNGQGQGHGQGAKKLNGTVTMPPYRGKPSDRDLDVKFGKHHIKIQARQKGAAGMDRYK